MCLLSSSRQRSTSSGKCGEAQSSSRHKTTLRPAKLSILSGCFFSSPATSDGFLPSRCKARREWHCPGPRFLSPPSSMSCAQRCPLPNSTPNPNPPACGVKRWTITERYGEGLRVSHRTGPSGEAVWTGRSASSLAFLSQRPAATPFAGATLAKDSRASWRRQFSGSLDGVSTTRRRPMGGGVYRAPSGLRLHRLPPSPFFQLALPPMLLLRLSPARLAHSSLPWVLVTFPVRFATHGGRVPSYPSGFWHFGDGKSVSCPDVPSLSLPGCSSQRNLDNLATGQLGCGGGAWRNPGQLSHQPPFTPHGLAKGTRRPHLTLWLGSKLQGPSLCAVVGLPPCCAGFRGWGHLWAMHPTGSTGVWIRENGPPIPRHPHLILNTLPMM